METTGRTRWERVRALFHHVVGLPADQQIAHLQAECDDLKVRAQVIALLQEEADGRSLLDRDLAAAARRVLAGRREPIRYREFGRYHVLGTLGRGGMGVVYLARRTDLGTLVAIKTLGDSALSPARRERFRREQQTLAELSHPFIARLYDADALPDGSPYFVMEFVDGAPLTEYCRARSAPLGERLRLFLQICEAVEHAHGRAVIHRDLKPSNILVGRDGTAKLLDFGIAKQLEELGAVGGQTRTELRLLTPAYAAPEQFRGEPLGVHTDVYSLGVVLYELLTGRLPFDPRGRRPAEVERLVTLVEPERPSAVALRAAGRAGAHARVGRSAWADLDALCLTAMQKDPSRRYRSVEALGRDVRHFLQGEPLEARPDAIRYRVGKFIRRHRRAVSLAAAAAAVIIGLAGYATARIARARDAAVAEAARTQRVRAFLEELLTSGEPDAGRGRDLRVAAVLARGARTARALTGDPEVQAELLGTLGVAYQSLGELDQADELLGLALEKRRAQDGDEAAATLVAATRLALLRDDQARYREAEALLRRVRQAVDQTLAEADERRLAAHEALGRVLIHVNRHEEARQLLEQMVAVRSRGNHDRRLAVSLGLLGVALHRLGHFAEADDRFRRALAIDRALLGDRHPVVAADLYSIAAVQLEWGNHAEAEKLDRQAVAVSEAYYGRAHPETASGLTELGRALLAQDKLTEAGPVLAEALATNERVFGRVHARVASTLNDLGHLAMAEGRLADAESLYRRQASIYDALFTETHYLKGMARANLGWHAVVSERYADAERLSREAMAIYRDTLPPGHPMTASVAIQLGRALLRQGRPVEAEPHSLHGYEILAAQPGQRGPWLDRAREDLVAIYEATARPGAAVRYRAELTAAR